MNARIVSRLACAAFLLMAGQMLVAPARAQQASPGAVTAARELVELKGGSNMFDPIVTGIVEQTKTALIQTNPQLAKDLNDVSALLRTEYGAKRAELVNEAAKFYAQRFTEPELKDLVTFFKSPLGKKMLVQEPLVLDDTFNFVQQQWAPRVGEEIMVRFRAEMKKKGHNL
jgi:hypothetical protein